MKTGLESLDVGAPEITYSGNQGPKSPQEDQQKMAEFQMAQLEEEYAKYVFEMEEQGIQPMSMQQFMEQAMAEARQGVKDGGVMQLVKENEDGSRPGYRGSDYGDEARGTGAYGGGDGGGDGNFDRPNMADIAGPVTAPPDMSHFGDTGDIVQANFTPYNKRPDTITSYIHNLKSEIKSNPFGFATPTAALINSIKVANMTGKAKGLMGISKNSFDDDDDDDTGGGSGVENYIPTVNLATIAKPITTDIEDRNTFELRPDDFVSRFSIPDEFRQKAAFGGIMGLDGRRAYGLGSRLKRAFKKLTKSKIGKIALAYLIGTGLGSFTKSAAAAGTGSGFSRFKPQNLAYLTGYQGKDLVEDQAETLARSQLNKINLAESENILSKVAADKARDDLTLKKILGDTTTSASKKPGLGTMAAIVAPAILGGLYTKKTEENQPTLDEAMAQTSRGASPFDQYGGVQGFRDMIGRGNLDRSLFPFLQPTSYAANGGRIGFNDGNYVGSKRNETLKDEYNAYVKEIELGLNEYANKPMSFSSFKKMSESDYADGGRIGYDMGGIAGLRSAALNEIYGINDDEDEQKLALGGSAGMPPVTMMSEGMDLMSFPDDESTGMTQATPTTPNQMPMPMPMKQPMMDPRIMQMMAQRGNPMMNRSMMQQPRIMAQEGGMMDMGGMEKDYRNEGGFVPIGGQERADDVPARLSKNEFVFTADAVRNAGGGDIDKGAEIMENMMENLEQGGKVSKGSQGLKGAREMFATQQRLGEVL